MVQQWEYRVFKFKPTGIVFRGGNIDTRGLTNDLNAYGRGGWEVAGVFSSSIGEGATNEVAIILKRPVEQRASQIASQPQDEADEGAVEGAAIERAATRAILRATFKKGEAGGGDAIKGLLARPGMWDQIMQAEAWDLAPTIFRAARMTIDPTDPTRSVIEIDRPTTSYVNALPHSVAVRALESAIASSDSDIRTLLAIAQGRQLARYEFIRDVLRDGPVALRPRVLQLLSSTQRTVRTVDADVLQEIATLVATPGRFASLKLKHEEKGIFGTKTVIRCRACQQEWPQGGAAPFCSICNRDELGFAERDLKPKDAVTRAIGLGTALRELQEAGTE